MREAPELRALQPQVRYSFARMAGGAAFMLLVLVTSMLAAACADTFEPIDPGGPPFSVFGYLDPSADTQWIRVTPLRTVLRGSADPTGVAVTLEELGSGRIIQMRDSTIRWGTMLGSDSVYAHTFWTTERIERGASYRFRAQGADGAVAESVVQVPQDYDLEVLISQIHYWSYLRAEGLKQVAFVFWNSTVRLSAGSGRLTMCVNVS